MSPLRTASGPPALLGALVVGILAGDRLGPSPARAALAGGVALGCVALALPGRRALLVAAVGITLVGAALSQRAHDGLVHSPLAGLVDQRASVSLSGTLVDDPDGARFATDALVRATTVATGGDDRDAGGRAVLVTATGDAAARLRVLAAGEYVALEGWLRPLEGRDRRLRWRHVVAQLDSADVVGFGGPRSPLARIGNRARALVTGGLDRLPTVDRALAAGFLLGDTRGVPEGVEDQFRASGLAHLLAVSGANVAFVLALAAPVLRFLALRGRLAGGLAVLAVFGTMTRWEPSVLRACAMATCAMVGLYVGRPTAGVRVLALAAMGLLLADPFLLHSIGFLLSCGASAGIAVLARPLARRLPGPATLREALAVTLAAQVGVAPILLPVFGSVPVVALPANLLAVPAVAPLTAWGMVAMPLAGAIGGRWPDAAGALELPTVLLVRYVRGVAAVASRAPLTIDGRTACALLALGAALAALRARTSTLRHHGPVSAR